MTQSEGSVALLPDPSPRPVRYTIISVDDHLVEPREMFEGRLPKRFADLAPRVQENPDGSMAWVYDGQVFPQMGHNAVVGQADRAVAMEPTSFDGMRRGCWDVHERI